MRINTYSRRLVPFIALVAVTLAVMPTSSPIAAQSPVAVPTPTSGGSLHPKSAAGLMPPAYGQDPNNPPLRVAGTIPTVSFLSPYASYPTGGWPQVLAAGKLAGDERNHVALGVGSYFDPENDNTLQLFSLTDNVFARSARLPGGGDPEAMVVRDLNQDGKPDVAMALAGTQELVFYGQPLAGEQRIALAGAPDALTTGDFDGDLHPDLAAVAPQTGLIHLWKGSPNGLAKLPFTLPYPTGGYDALATGDIDNDGDDDIIALRGAGYTTNSVVIYPQQSGTFPISYTLSPQIGGYLPQSMDVGDVNGDGRDDIVVTAGGNMPYAYLNIFLQTDTGIASTPITYKAYHLPSAIKVADVNHDGREDVVALNDGWRTVSVYTQNAEGTLDPYAVADIPYSSRYRPDALEVADLDGNGSLDVALVDQSHGLMVLNNTLTAPTSTIVSPPNETVVEPGALAVTGTASTNAVKVEVRIRGLTAWTLTTLAPDATWHAELSLPNQARAWWIEARATDAQGHVQAPVAQQRVSTGITTPVIPDTRCYTVADNDNVGGSADSLVSFLRSTLKPEVIGATGTRSLNALALKPGTDTLYASVLWRLGKVDIETGSFTPLPQPFGEAQGVQGQSTLYEVESLAFDPTSDVLYGVEQTAGPASDLLFQIDPVTGAHISNAFGPKKDYVPITLPTGINDVDDITFDPATGQLYGVASFRDTQSTLITIDKQTGAGAVIKPLGIDHMDGLSFTNASVLYGTSGSPRPGGATGADNRLYEINPHTGDTKELLYFDLPHQADYDSIACQIPSSYTNPLQVKTFTVNGGTPTVHTAATSLAVQLAPAAANAGDRTISVAGYSYNGTGKQWMVNQRADGLHPTGASTAWQIKTPGMVYFNAWATSAQMGVGLAYQTWTNYIPETDQLAQGQRRIYRYMLQAGQHLTVQAQPVTGDVDLAVWALGDTEGTYTSWFSNLSTGTDTIDIVAPTTGIYQIEVSGATATTYTLGVTIDATLRTQGVGGSGGINASKLQPTQPTLPLDSIPAIQRTLPDGSGTLEDPQTALFLPLVIR